jgi:Protein of unknown function (DUF2783)
MSELNLSPNLESADDFYASLLEAHEGLDEKEIHALNARLILILANHIGEQKVLVQALKAAGGKP